MTRVKNGNTSLKEGVLMGSVLDARVLAGSSILEVLSYVHHSLKFSSILPSKRNTPGLKGGSTEPLKVLRILSHVF